MSEKTKSHTIAVIGGGPAGLMAAEVLSQSNITVNVYDAMPSVGRKFLMAGKGGMNITHSEDFATFISRYGIRKDEITALLTQFTPQDLRTWIHQLGIETFVGSSGRVFPRDMKAAPLLRAWLHRLRTAGVNFHMRHRWLGWSSQGDLMFESPQGQQGIKADAVLLALGGGSWARLGSDGTWVPLLQQHGVAVSALKPANCGFDIRWSEHFSSRHAGEPLKSVTLSFSDTAKVSHFKHGECLVTASGIEGSLIYAMSANIRDTIAASGKAVIYLDLLPHRDMQHVVNEIAHPRGSRSMSSHLQSRLGIKGVKAGLLREQLTKEDFADPIKLAAAIKRLPLALIAARPLDEAISSAGGVMFEALNEQLMIRNMPGTFCAGEMLDWEAPTGGYLLTACFASGLAAGKGMLDWLKNTSSPKTTS